jgi:hypothetical protein
MTLICVTKINEMKKVKLTKDELQELVEAYKSDLRMLEFEVERVNSALEVLQKTTPLKGKTILKNTGKKKRGRPKKEKTEVKKTGTVVKRKRGRPAGKKSAKTTVAKSANKTTKGKRGRPAGKTTAKPGRPAKTKKPVVSKKKVKLKKTAAPKGKITTGKNNRIKKNHTPKIKEARQLVKQPLVKAKTPKPEKISKSLVWEDFILNSIRVQKRALIKSDLFLLVTTSGFDFVKNLDEKEINQRLSNAIIKLTQGNGPLVKAYHLGKGNAFAFREWVDKDGNLLTEFER